MAEPTRAELDAQAESLGLDPANYGSKQEVVDAIEAINPPPEDTETPGRPPLGELAEERVENRNVRSLPAREEA